MSKNQDPGSGINIPDPQHCKHVFRILNFLNQQSLFRRVEDILKPHLGEGGLDELRICALWQQEFSVVLTEHRPD